ncbi:MAG: 6-phosphofructokinase, partial [Nitrospinota bacterium]|nr:6-phosphofructokinase [Nitrospinota bacterium]
MKIGVLTGGGDCPGLNAVIRGIIRSATHLYNWEIKGFLNGYKGLIENKFIDLTLQADAGLIQRGGTIIGTSNRDNPFSYRERVSGQNIIHDVSDRVVKNYAKNELDALVVIGGDGTLSTALKLSEMGINIVGVPKTIDNDLSATDYTFGFDTAVNIVTDAIDRLKTTAESHDRVMVVEVMGRDTGWIALYSGLAGGANIILIPEIPYDIDKVCKKIYERKSQGKNFSIVVVAEGAKPLGGEVTVKRHVDDPTISIRLGGVGNVIGDDIEERTNIETRVTALGHIQRGGKPSAFDRVLCSRLGVEAVQMIKRKEFGMMACLRTPHIKTVPLKEAAVT